MSHSPFPTYHHHSHPHSHGRQPIQVHDHDILCGRGVNIASHPGNERFRALVQTRLDENYCTAYTTSEKRAVAEQILLHIKALDPPGRFLRRIGRAPTSRGLSGPWEELADREAVKKTCQALRDCNRHDRGKYAETVAIPEDVRRDLEFRAQTGLSNKEQAAAAAAAKARAEAGPGMPLQSTLPAYPHPSAMGASLTPGPTSNPYHSGGPGVHVQMAVHMAPPPMSAAGAPMPAQPDRSATSSHVYSAHMHLAPPHQQMLHHYQVPPPSSIQVHQMHHHHQQHSGHHIHLHGVPGHTPVHGSNLHATLPQLAPLQPLPLASLPVNPSPPVLLQPHEFQPAAAHHQASHQDLRRHSQSSEASSKRSRSTFEDEGTVSPSVENAADWLKKQKSVDTRAPLTTVTISNTITPTDSVGPGFRSDPMMTGYEAIASAMTPCNETSASTGTTPTSDATNTLLRHHRPSLSPATAMPPSPALAYHPLHAGPADPTLYSPHDYNTSPPTPMAEHPYAFHPYHEQAGVFPSDPKLSYLAAADLDQQQLEAAAEAAADAVTAADCHIAATANCHIGSDFSNSSPGSFLHDDSLPLL